MFKPKGSERIPTDTNHARVKKPGGPAFHKPGCQCNYCKSRARAEEAESLTAGDGGRSLDAETPEDSKKVINADLPILYAKDHSPRARIGDWIAMRSLDPSLTNAAIAEKMGIKANTLNSIINRATAEGWLKFDDPMSRIEHQIIPKVLDNLDHFLKHKDKTVTIETAKGTVFRSYQDAKGISDAPQTVLMLKIEQPEEGTAKIINGTIVGSPKLLEE